MAVHKQWEFEYRKMTCFGYFIMGIIIHLLTASSYCAIPSDEAAASGEGTTVKTETDTKSTLLRLLYTLKKDGTVKRGFPLGATVKPDTMDDDCFRTYMITVASLLAAHQVFDFLIYRLVEKNYKAG